MYKKVYVEITNSCNLNCNFCIQNKREKKFISTDEFKNILSKLNGYTKYLYFHILGEPLLHPQINNLINMASENYFVNITTNGYLINKIKDNKNIRRLNISLHSFDPRYSISFEEYINNIFSVVDILKEYTDISYRIWTDTKFKNEFIKKLENKYNVKINGNTKLDNKVFINFEKSFIWPDLDNNLYVTDKSCYGLKDHFGILVDGTIVPCCLDSKGTINLGNIYKDNLDEVLKSKRVTNMVRGFQNNKRCEELCKHCGFRI